MEVAVGSADGVVDLLVDGAALGTTVGILPAGGRDGATVGEAMGPRVGTTVG